jgi:hypothetical protein
LPAKELATLTGTPEPGSRSRWANAFAFLTLFPTPVGIAPLLSPGSWPLVWHVRCVFTLIALCVFPGTAPDAYKRRGAGVVRGS